MIDISRSTALRSVIILLGLLVVIPWNVIQALGHMFTFREQELLSSWIFVYVSFVLNVPAVLLSFCRPRLGAWWLLTSIAISISMTLALNFQTARELGTGLPFGPREEVLRDWALLALQLWFANIGYAVLLLFFAKRSRLVSAKEAATKN